MLEEGAVWLPVKVSFFAIGVTNGETVQWMSNTPSLDITGTDDVTHSGITADFGAYLNTALAHAVSAENTQEIKARDYYFGCDIW